MKPVHCIQLKAIVNVRPLYSWLPIPQGCLLEIMVVNVNDRNIKFQNIFKFKIPSMKWKEQKVRSLGPSFIFTFYSFPY